MIVTLPAFTAFTAPVVASTVATFSSEEEKVTFATLGHFLAVNVVSDPTITSAGAVVNLRPALITAALAVRVLETFLFPFLAVTLTKTIYARKLYRNAIKWGFLSKDYR